MYIADLHIHSRYSRATSRELTPEWIENEAGERVDSTPHAMEKYTMPTPELPPMSLLRRKTAE